MRTYTLCVIVCVLALSTMTAHAYRLQFKDAKGASRSYNTSMHIQGTMETMGMSIPMDSTVDMTSVEKVLSKANGVSSLSYSVKEGTVKATVSIPDDDEDQNIEQPLPPFGFTYKRTPTGKVTNIKMNGDIAPEVQQQLDMMNGQLQYPGQGLEFPAKDLKIGDTWKGTQKFELTEGTALDLKVTYILSDSKVVDGKTFLVIDCDIDTKASNLPVKVASPTGEGTLTMKVSMNITGTQTVLFDPSAGEVGDSTMNMDIDLKMATEGAEGMTITSKLTLEGEVNRQ